MATTKLFDPQGNLRDIPDDQVDAALSAGGKRAVQMTDPNGVLRHVPEDQQDAALKAGGKLYQQPGVLKRFAVRAAQGLGIPTSAEELKQAVAGPTSASGAIEDALPPGEKMLYGYGKNLYQQGKKAVGEVVDAGKNIGAGQPIVPNLVKAGGAGGEFAVRGVLGPLGTPLMNAGEDAYGGPGNTYGGVGSPEYAGSVAASLASAALMKGAKEAKNTPGALKKVARNIVSAGDRDVLDAATKTANTAAAAADITRAGNQGRDELTLSKRGSVDEANALALKNHANAVQQTIADNTEIARKHAADTAAVKQENAQRLDAFNRQGDVGSEINDRSAELNRRVQQAEVNANNENNTNWNNWRDKVANTKADTQNIVDTIRAQGDKLTDPAARSEFKQIIAGAKPEAGDMSAFEKDRQDIIDGNFAEKGTQYQDLPPDKKAAVDKIMGDRGLEEVAGEPESGEGENKTEDTSTKQVPATLLHGWKTALEGSVRSAKDGTVRYAIGKVLDAVRDEEGNVSKAAGPEAQQALEAARATHGPYVETFRNSPNEPPTVASDFQKKTIPDFVAQQKLNEQAARLNHYDPQIGVQAAHIAQLQRQAEALGKVAPIGKGETPLPEPPKFKPLPEAPGTKSYAEPEPNKAIERPEVSAQKIREDLIKKTAARWRQTSQYQVRRLATSGIGSIIGAFAGHPGLGAGVGYAASEFVPKIAANIIEKPAVLKWLAEPSLGDINALKTIPHADQIVIADAIARTAVDEAQAGRPVKVGKDAVHFLGPARLAAIHNANIPKTAADAKRRIKDNQGDSNAP